MIYQSVEDLIGHTPLLDAKRYTRQHGLEARLLVKLEGWNPSGSVKDRIASEMLRQAEQDGRLHPGGVLIEPTSGNTGIGLAMLAAVKGYRVILTMPDTMSVERRKLLQAYGAEAVLTEGKLGMSGAIAKARELAEHIPGSLLLGQFENPANPSAHLHTTGPEIWENTDGDVDVLVAGVGSGGTLAGVGNYLRSKNPHLHIVAVEPAESPVLSGGKPGVHGIEGIGAGFIPEWVRDGLIDQVVSVTMKQASEAGKLFARLEGVLVGISAGAALHAAMTVAQHPIYQKKTVVAILPDGIDRYYSTMYFDTLCD